MADLEYKTKISPLQLSILLIELCIGISMITTTPELVAEAKESTWLSVLLGGAIFGGAALLILKLGSMYPAETFVEYMPRIWGTLGGNIIIYWFNVLMCLMFSLAMAGFSRIITFFLFDRTPTEVIALGMLVVCIYAALQDLGTILRLQQILFFTMAPLFTIVWLPSFINFQPENLLPLRPESFIPVATASLKSWPIFGGYEFILLLLPFVHTKNKKMALAIGGALGYVTLTYTLLILITIGVLSAEAVKQNPYPLLEVIRGIQIPGTFIERLEGYFLLLWIPITIDGYLFTLWGLAQIMQKQYQYKDHRPCVLILAPLMYTISILLDSLSALTAINTIDTWLGLLFSFVIIPISLMLASRQKRSDLTCKKNAEN